MAWRDNRGVADPSIVSICVSREMSVEAERVFDAWLHPEHAGNWLFATDDGTITRCETEPHVGGTFLIADRRAGEEVVHTGEYTALDRPRHLAFTLLVPKYSSDWSRVTVEILPMSAICQLTLTHSGIAPDMAGEVERGWEKLLERLDAALSGG
jgi:uncharacterized protein YndB with AHSA1/START domain